MKDQLYEILRAAGARMTGARDLDIERKEGHANFVTSADRAVQRFLAERLTALLPGSRLIGEEQDNAPLDDAPTWVVDPIDGTTNFIHDYRASAISVALLRGGKPQVGAIHQPYTGELFYAEAGRGAWLNDAPIRVSNRTLPQALVGCGTAPYNAELAERSLGVALDFLRVASDIRRCGSAALELAYVACGRQEVYFELKLSPWDYAAGALIVTEAGGVFAMPGKPCPDFSAPGAVLATNAACAADASRLLKARPGDSFSFSA